MFELRWLRNFLGLRQKDVERATGVSVGRLSAAENGKRVLNATELRAVEEFYKARLRMIQRSRQELATGIVN